ncbi:MAG TPA: HypC/HybG/HupF family hydrogenase formation chaperone [Acidimicrobiales bacterium]|nr:HypC/HybG/HupF family hydrogenase formation chaperone [Acidimicrobiales bacterium]
MSRFHRVVARAGDRAVLVADSRGTTHRVSLLALDGPPPEPGDWLVVHSGYALDRVDRDAAGELDGEVHHPEVMGERP